MIELFKQTYTGESVVDMYRDVSECLDPAFNALAQEIPQDEYGFQKGTFVVTVVWNPDE